MKITKDTTLDEILKIEGAEGVLARHKVPCLGCAFAQYEMKELKIGDVCKMYGIGPQAVLKDLNSLSSDK